MTSCIVALYIATLGAPVAGHLQAPPAAAAAPDNPDTLYARRETLSDAWRAAAIWAERLRKDPGDFVSAWKLARARYWLGGHAGDADRKRVLEEGVAAGRAAAALAPSRPEGHFWLAANMGALAESFGVRQGLKYRGTIRDELLTVLKLDRSFQQGSADRALGRWYFRVPGMFGGSKQKSEEHLRASLNYGPESTASHFFLAETLFAAGRDDDARAELQRVIDAPLDPEWAPEDREFKAKARERLKGS